MSFITIRPLRLHYGREPGSKLYSGLSDQYGYYSILPISPIESEAVYVLDGLFGDPLAYAFDGRSENSDIAAGRHQTDKAAGY